MCLLCAECAWGQYAGSGSSVFTFMDLPVSSRLNALGGSNVSIRDGDVSMAMCNPALLGEMTDKVLQLNYSYYLPGTMFGSVLYGHNFGRSKIEKGYSNIIKSETEGKSKNFQEVAADLYDEMQNEHLQNLIDINCYHKLFL